MTKVPAATSEDVVQAAETDERQPNLQWLSDVLVDGADAAGIGIVVTQVVPELRHIYVSRAAAEIFGLSQESALEDDPRRHFAKEAQSKIVSLLRDVATDDTSPLTLETTITAGRGSPVTIEASVSRIEIEGKPALVSFLVNVTKRRIAEQSLEMSEQRFRNVVESVPEAIFITQGSTLHYGNPAFVELLGLPAESIEGLSMTEFAHPEDVARLTEARSSLGVPAPVSDYRMTTRDRRVVILELSSIGVEFEGEPMMLWFGREVTERKQMESQLMQADRLAALGTLAGGMAHAINNPLSYVLLNLEHLSKRLPELRTRRGYLAEARVRLNEAYDGAERVAAVVRQMRLFSRMRRVEESGPLTVTDILDGALQLVGNEIRHRGQLVTTLRPVPQVFGREGQLEQAFLTLLIFAARLLPEEGNPRPQMHISTGSNQGRVEVTVKCIGAPLNSSVRQRIFEPFGGAGDEPALGLAMCADILQSMKGGITVDGDERATVFRVVLPVQEATEATLERINVQRLASASPPGARARVLVIDDDPGVSSALRLMLQEHHDVTSVGSAREALELLLKNLEYDIVFCDFVMPDMSGEDVYYALKLNRPGIETRLVFMTGAVFSPEAERFLGQIENPRLEKPFNLQRVEELVHTAVRESTG